MLLYFIVLVIVWSIMLIGRRWYYYLRLKRIKDVQQLYNLGWRDFEYWTALKFKKRGYSIQVWKGIADEGVDVFAKKKGNLLVIQCKKYKLSKKITVQQIREIFWVATSMNAKACIVCTCSFTKPVKLFAKKNDVLLFGKDNLHLL